MAPDRQSEDCLTVEKIFTPTLDGAAPVLVWVPGGSYRIGGAGLDTYDGAALTPRASWSSALNYRLGVLGWLGLDGVPTNLGLRDLRAPRRRLGARRLRRRSAGIPSASW